jgi:hypothetical protein
MLDWHKGSAAVRKLTQRRVRKNDIELTPAIGVTASITHLRLLTALFHVFIVLIALRASSARWRVLALSADMAIERISVAAFVGSVVSPSVPPKTTSSSTRRTLSQTIQNSN